ncbi:MAG: protein kinase domain-containing protein [Dethiobacteria bacterium]
MDLANLCMGCMAPKNGQTACPKCGWREGSAPESPQHLPPRTLLNRRYLIGRVLGQGAFGITYLAWDSNLEIKVAIKEYFPCDLVHRQVGHCSISIHTGSLAEPYIYGLEKFFAEAKTLLPFREHTNIVTVLDYFKANGTAYLVMNYLEGVTLKEYLLGSRTALTFGKIMEIMVPVMDALKGVHAAGILHRDVSPDNIFLTRDKKVVLIDFGAARHAMVAKKSGLSVILKLGYAPEEQYRSKGEQGPWTDVYAVAATIYRAITGRMPPESLDRMGQDSLVPPSALGVKISPREEAALLRGMAVCAKKRYQTIEELEKALRNDGAGEQTVLGKDDEFETEGHPPGQPDPGTSALLYCEVVEGPNKSLTMDLSTGEVKIGRDRGFCNLVLDDEEISRRHASISVSPEGKTWIRDLNSTNGTFVNGRRIQEATSLIPGDMITMGTSRLHCREKERGEHDMVQPPPPYEDDEEPYIWAKIALLATAGAIILFLLIFTLVH